jgi:hypothetical protein
VDAVTSQEFADRLMYAIGAADSIARSVGLRPDPALYHGRRTDDGLELVMESATARETWEIKVRKLP